ncbi:MAG TPA: anthrone oxygenase family protein [Actinomycetes bacterium]
MVAATLTAGLMAGLFAAFWYAVMPGLAKASDLAFVEGMQRINVAILNGWFFLSFAGALLLTALAAVLHLPAPWRGVLVWIVAALVLYVVVLVVTMAVNVPLNDRLAAGGSGAPGALRAAFEAPWVRWNLVRTLASTAAFGCLTWALVLAGRVSAAG